MDYRRTGWAFVDQGIVSLGTFLTNIILARYLAPSEYGVFALLLTVSYGTAIVTSFMANYPLALRLPHAQSDERGRLTTGAILVVATFCVPLSGVIAVVLYSFDRPELIVPAVSAFLFWQIQLTARRVLLFDLRQRDAVVGDAVSSLGLLLVLLVNMANLSLSNALYYLAATSLLGAIIQSLQLRLSIKAPYGPYRWLLDNAPLSLVLPPLASGALWTFRMYGMLWLLAAVSGAVAVASLQAALTIFNLLNPLFVSLMYIITGVTARSFDGGDRQAAWRAARPFLLLALPPIILYLGLVLLFPRHTLLVFYGQDSPYLELGYLFPYLAMFTAAMLPADLIITFFLGMRETRLVLRIHLIGIAATVFSMPLLLATFGALEGICLTLAVSEIVRLILSLRYLTNLQGGHYSKFMLGAKASM